MDQDPNQDTAPITCEWAVATGGALSDPQRIAIKRAIRRGYLDIVLGLARWPFRKVAAVEPPNPPDSRLAREAEEAAKDQGPAVAGHGYRTWFLGAALAAGDGRGIDGELLYVASLLHDAGLVTAVSGEDFTIRSARSIEAVCRKVHPNDAELPVTLGDAVVAHATPGLTLEQDPLGFYIQAGAMADLGGMRMWDLPKGYLRSAYEAYPANGVHSAVSNLLTAEAGAVPLGRFAQLHRAGVHRVVQFSLNRRF
jgi:hypothetical protein